MKFEKFTNAQKSSLTISLVFILILAIIGFGFYDNNSVTSFAKAALDKNELENYDIRKDDRAKSVIAEFRASSGKTESFSFDENSKINSAIKLLKHRIPKLKIENNETLNVPEVISADLLYGKAFLTLPSTEKRSEILRRFIQDNNQMFGLSDEQISQLKVTADYTNPNGELAFAHLAQEINRIPVFQGEIKAGFTKNGEIIRVINNLASGLDYKTLSVNFGSPEDALLAAYKNIGKAISRENIERNEFESNSNSIKFGQGEWATTVEKTYFPLEAGVVRPSWRILIWEKESAFYVIVDAESGTLLWRKNLSEFQTQPATYNVYGNTTSLMKTEDSPAPFTPGPNSPNGQQAPLISRTNFTLVGNEPPYTFNNLGWIPDGINETDGNAVEAGIDRDGTNGVDPNGKAYGNPNRVFSYVYNPSPGNPPPGEEPVPPAPQPYPPTAFQQGSITHAFYVANRYHDETYRLGFTEQALNFQQDNFGRGGQGNDRISVEVQDSSGTNNTNFATPADGGRGRLQLFVWTGPTPDRDGALDSQFIVHELTHGLSNRLHGNGIGLSTNMSRGMGEGWSDFYAISMLSEPTDNPLGIHAVGGYITYLLTPTFDNNYYYGIRRFPYAVISSLGPNGRPHNPLTFRYINADCDTVIGTTSTTVSSAYPRNPVIATSGGCDQVSNAGEFWGSVLWEVRGQLVNSNGAVEGNRKALQFVTDGMKLAPLAPTMIQERDAIIAATMASGTAQDVRDVWRGFALRGLGFSARILSVSPANVVEAFDTPNLLQSPQMTVSDAAPGGNGNGFPEEGETVQLTIPLTNQIGNTATNVTLQVVNGGSADYGTIANGQTVTRTVSYTIPFGTCGTDHPITLNVNSSLGATNFTRTIRVGVPVGGSPLTIQNTNPITIKDNAPAAPYPSTINVSGFPAVPNVRIKVSLRGFTHTFPADVDVLLVGPGGQKMIVMSDVGDGDDISNIDITLDDAAANQLPASGLSSGIYKPTNSGVNDPFMAPAPAAPYENPAPSGTATLASAFGTNGSAMNGTWSLYVVDDAGSDAGSFFGGWSLTFQSNTYLCGDPGPKTRGDFDGDGKTDVAVVRGDAWYILRSTSGFTAWSWGLNSDKFLVGDINGDGKADSGVFRSNESSNSMFFMRETVSAQLKSAQWGLASDIPLLADFDGDFRDDFAVFRPANGTWYLLRSSTGFAFSQWGQSGDKPIVGDFDGDNKSDFTVFRNGVWFIKKSSGGTDTIYWGLADDKPVPADYDFDGKIDAAVYRPSDGTWYIRKSTSGMSVTKFGIATDIPVPGDYDGDGRADLAVFRDGYWYILGTLSGFRAVQFGIAGDKPVPNLYLPQ